MQNKHIAILNYAKRILCPQIGDQKLYHPYTMESWTKHHYEREKRNQASSVESMLSIQTIQNVTFSDYQSKSPFQCPQISQLLSYSLVFSEKKQIFINEKEITICGQAVDSKTGETKKNSYFNKNDQIEATM